jgi:tRNA A-37 threonylcarbamoyl transferase component Bud32
MSDYTLPPDTDLDELKGRSEEIGGGMTNEVYRVEDTDVLEAWDVDADSVILKEYDDEPGLSLAVTHYGRLRDNIETARRVPDEGLAALRDLDLEVRDYVSMDERMDNEETAVDELAGLDAEVPGVVYRDDEHMAFEEITDADPFPAYVDEIEPEEAYEAARDVGELTAAMHDADVVKMDNRLENVLVTDEGYASIDWEYTITDADDWDKAADVITFISSAKLLDRETYTAVRQGFTDGYTGGEGPALEGIERGFTAVTSSAHPVAEAVKEREFRESARDWKRSIANNVYDGLDALIGE